MSQGGRVYGGRSEDERKSDRRARLLEAGLELFGTEGWSVTTIEKLCTHASVATRSLYEEFASREALLLAVYEAVMNGVLNDVVPQVLAHRGDPRGQVRIGLQGYVGYLTADPRRAAVVHREIRVAGTLESARHKMVLRFADMIARQARLLDLDGAGRTQGLALAGAVNEVMVAWVAHDEPRPEPGPIVEVLVDFYEAVLFRSGAAGAPVNGAAP